MSAFKLHRFVVTAIVVAGALMAGTHIAMSDTIDLMCTNNERPADPPFSLILDKSASTVTSIYNGQSTVYQATFLPTQIVYQDPYWKYTIDRVSGIVAVDNGSGTILHWTCHVGTAF